MKKNQITKNRIYLFTLIVFTLFLISLINNSYLIKAQESPQQSLNEYYDSFMAEDLERYLAVSYLGQYSEEAIQDKREYLTKLFEIYDTEYYQIDDLLIELKEGDSYAYLEYTLKTRVLEYGNPFEYSKRMSAILIYDNGWKIFQVIPTSVYTKNLIEDYSEPVLNETEQINLTICEYNESKMNTNEYDLSQIPMVSTLIGDNKYIKAQIDGKEYYYLFKDGKISSTSQNNEDYLIILDGCTMQRIFDGSNPEKEYKNGKIIIEGKNTGASIKTWFGELIYNIYSFFKKPPYEIWTEAESGTLIGAKSYSFIGQTSRSSGEAYLGDGGASVRYVINSNYQGIANLYVAVSDDGLHQDGARNVIFNVNGADIPYNHKSTNYIVGEKHWGWEYLGEVNLFKGENIITITKPQTTSAAFVMDKFVILQDKKELNNY